MRLGVQAAGRIDDEDVDASRQGPLTGVVGDAGGVGPGGARTISQPARCAQISSWSAAAARKVSQAPRMIDRPWSLSRWASLAMEVVLPEPLTPAIR